MTTKCWIGLVGCGLLATSCFSVDLDELAKEPPAKQRYMLEIRVPTQPPLLRPKKTRPVLMVERVHAASPYNGRPFVYRTGEHAHTLDYYNEFLVSPAEQLTQLARQWLRAQSGFPLVVNPDSQVVADSWLSIDLTELRADFRDEDQPRATVRIRATLVRKSTDELERQLEFLKEYDKTIALSDATPVAIAEGFSQAVAVILGQLASDLRPFGDPKPDGK